MSDVRQATDKILEMVEEGILDKDTVIMSCLKYMSDMAHSNEFFINEEDEDEEDDWDGSNYPKDNPLGENV
jgi:hypothetical protein